MPNKKDPEYPLTLSPEDYPLTVDTERSDERMITTIEYHGPEADPFTYSNRKALQGLPNHGLAKLVANLTSPCKLCTCLRSDVPKCEKGEHCVAGIQVWLDSRYDAKDWEERFGSEFIIKLQGGN